MRRALTLAVVCERRLPDEAYPAQRQPTGACPQAGTPPPRTAIPGRHGPRPNRTKKGRCRFSEGACGCLPRRLLLARMPEAHDLAPSKREVVAREDRGQP